ncbi:hypothetical protein DFR49_2309 [Hephaestia caeni]|uniref:DNA transposition AAA+ family ATPase n=1 Tax=Hephaestia caeni TaxID=645617 RepID=A0A397P498_9SPHN|nr:AAA family ATPase [Hephaestia caeni]RIA44072.1 hypothetical protein DFR49_2309 [Hephaestia caeni]
MNDPSKTPVDVEELRAWVLDYKERTGLSYSELAPQSGVAYGTLTQFVGGGYGGNNEAVARKLLLFRQRLAMQAELALEAPEIPDYFETGTSRQIVALLTWAQRGRITVVASGPGTGKTITCRHYQAAVANVWVATMTPSTSGVNNMQIEVLAALGERDAVGTSQKLSRRVRERVRNTGGLIIIDEAQHLSEKSVEEIRSWHDAEGIGIALLGNESVIARLEGGTRRAHYAQLYSRVGMRLVRNVPLAADARALAEAWGLEDAKEIAFIQSIATKPGGLRGCTMVLELATMIAGGEHRARDLAHMQDAWAQLASRPIAS